MPLSDIYILQYLVQNTEAASDPICWQEARTGGAFFAEISGVRVEIAEAHSSTGSVLYVTFARGPEQVQIVEPRPALFSRKYRDEDERRLAELLRMLTRLIARQCTRRRLHLIESADELKQQIFHRLVFGAEG